MNDCTPTSLLKNVGYASRLPVIQVGKLASQRLTLRFSTGCYVLGATCAETGQAEELIAARLDTGIRNLFLSPLSRTLEPDVQAVLVWDGAGDHRSHDLICPPNITLLSLSRYSPELNPVENLWHDLRSHHWSNRKYETVDALFNAAETASHATGLDPTIIRTACRTPDTETRSYTSRGRY